MSQGLYSGSSGLSIGVSLTKGVEGLWGGASGLINPSGVPSPFDPDAQAYITAVETADGQALEDSVRIAIDEFVRGCKADGIWSAIKASAILAGARTLNGALTSLVGTAPTNFNFVSGDYNRKTGLKGDGSTKYLNTNRNNNADPQNDNHNAFWLNTDVNATTRIMSAGGAQTGVNSLFWFNNQFGARNRNSSPVSFTAGVSGIGLIGVSRNNSANVQLRVGGTTNTYSTVSQTPHNANINLFQGDDNFYFDGRIAFYSIGEALNLSQLDSRVSTLMTAINEALTVAATGGTETTINVGEKTYRVHTFLSNGTLSVTNGGDVEYLVVGGGGGGGDATQFAVAGGGGGAGGMLTGTIAVTAQAYPITVGAGGISGTTTGGIGEKGGDGGNSSFSTVTALGGGGGGGAKGGATGQASSGGSGGGGTRAPVTAGSGTAGQGNDGGVGSEADNSHRAGGGGGGASAVGAVGVSSTSGNGGNGGNGAASSISGTSITYAGGGGGGFGGSSASRPAGTGGSGGGGNGGSATGSATTPGANGQANRGGGGGGAGNADTTVSLNGTGGNGGSGIVIVRYEVAA